MGAFFDGTLVGLHRTLADGRDNLRRQLRELGAADTEYRADVEQAVRLFEKCLAALPPAPGEGVSAPAQAPAAPQSVTRPGRQGSPPGPLAAPGRRR